MNGCQAELQARDKAEYQAIDLGTRTRAESALNYADYLLPQRCGKYLNCDVRRVRFETAFTLLCLATTVTAELTNG